MLLAVEIDRTELLSKSEEPSPPRFRFPALVSLYEMLIFYAADFINLMDLLTQMESELPQYATVREDGARQTAHILADVRGKCHRIELSHSIQQIDRILSERSSLNPQELSTKIKELRNRIEDELKNRLFLYVEKTKADFYVQQNPLFGPEVQTKFSFAIVDIEEAGKCMALGRSTACVFHLMRVVEVGLRALARTLKSNLDLSSNPSWEVILKKCDEEIASRTKQMSQEERTFFSDATASLRAIKTAWRNPTMHVEKFYDEERAREIFFSVGAFMRHLATRLSQ